jgi:nitrile hydratase
LDLSRASPASGARVVARARLDDRFRARLLDDADTASPELGPSIGGGLNSQAALAVERVTAACGAAAALHHG